ncbi:P-loop ATPase, Sll1717 family [Janthinobacterium aestuarii]
MLKLKDIYLGSVDAKNELLSNSPEERIRFYNSFVVPPSLNVDDFITRERYYALGLKGTGKTALLRYISIKLEDMDNSVSSFILFKSDLDEDMRHEFGRTAKLLLAAPNSDSFEGTDFESIWRWFIYRKIVEASELSESKAFQNNSNWDAFKELVRSEAMRSKTTGIMRLIPKITKGLIEVSRSPKLELNLDWNNLGVGRIKFVDLVRKADESFKNLSADNGRLNLFFDELELNHNTENQFERDVRLIRDLIVSIEKINGIAKSNGFPLCIYAAIRSEVQNTVASLGKEINKPLTDFGAEILWNRSGFDAGQQPLIFIIEQKLMIARSENSLPVINGTQLWSEYFPEEIDRMMPQRYILHNSWYRPRDIVRLLRTAQEQFPKEEKFSVQVLEQIRKKYSTASWVEITEELKAKYSSVGIEGIKHLLYGAETVMKIGNLEKRFSSLKNTYQEVEHLSKKANIQNIVKDLFRIGAIGNINLTTGRMRFSFRGDDEVLFDQHLIIHNALRAHLSSIRNLPKVNAAA